MGERIILKTVLEYINIRQSELAEHLRISASIFSLKINNHSQTSGGKEYKQNFDDYEIENIINYIGQNKKTYLDDGLKEKLLEIIRSGGCIIKSLSEKTIKKDCTEFILELIKLEHFQPTAEKINGIEDSISLTEKAGLVMEIKIEPENAINKRVAINTDELHNVRVEMDIEEYDKKIRFNICAEKEGIDEIRFTVGNITKICHVEVKGSRKKNSLLLLTPLFLVGALVAAFLCLGGLNKVKTQTLPSDKLVQPAYTVPGKLQDIPEIIDPKEDTVTKSDLIMVSGTARISADGYLWLFASPKNSNGGIWPQKGEIKPNEKNRFEIPCILGGPDKFTLFLVTVDKNCNEFLNKYLKAGRPDSNGNYNNNFSCLYFEDFEKNHYKYKILYERNIIRQ